MKKLGIAVGALILILIGAMAVIPLFVNVDKYRPQIVQAVDQRINGSLELGHLSLSLWGQVKIQVDGLSLKDEKGADIVSVKSAFFHLPFLSLLSGSPVLELSMDNPTVNVVKNRAGKLNVMTLMKTAQAAPSAPSAPSVPSGATGSTSATGGVSAEKVAVPAIVANARLGFDLSDATVRYLDETQGLASQMKDLNIVAHDLSLNHPSELSVWSDFDTKLGTSLSVKGPGRIDLELSPKVGGGRLLEFAMSGKADFDQIEISMPGTFEKKSGVPANVELSLNGSADHVNIEKADVHFFNAVFQSSGNVTHLDTTPTIRYSLKSNDIALGPWTGLLPLLSQYELGGKANLSADFGGESTKLSYQARIAVDGLTAKSPLLKEQPRVDGEILIATDQIQKLQLTMKAPGNELQVSGKVLSFAAPQATFDISSPGMDLDQLIDFRALQAKKEQSALNFLPSAYAGKTGKASSDFDAMLDPLRASAVARKASASIGLDLKMLKAYDAKMTDISGKLYYKDLAAGLQSFAMRVFGGQVQANLACQLQPRQPTYKFSAKVTGLDLGQAVQSQLAAFRNTATGKANFDLSGEGASFNPASAKMQLRAKGSMKISDAKLTTIDVGKMAVDGVKSALSKVSDKIPGLNRNFSIPHVGSKYQLISSDFGISGGKFTAPNLVGKAQPRQGIDFKGSATVGLKDQSIDAKIEIIDTYDLLKAKSFQHGLLCERGKPFILPVGVGCTLESPCYSYADSGAYLLKVAMNNTVGQMKTQVQNQLQNEAKKILGGGGGGSPNIGKALKGLFGN